MTEGVPAAGDHHPAKDTADVEEPPAPDTTETAGTSPNESLDVPTPELASPVPLVAVEDAAPPEVAPIAVEAPAPMPAVPALSPEAQLAAQWAARRATPLRTPQVWHQSAPVDERRAEAAVSVSPTAQGPEPELQPDTEPTALVIDMDTFEQPSRLPGLSDDEVLVSETRAGPKDSPAQQTADTPPFVPSSFSESAPPAGPSEPTKGPVDLFPAQTLNPVEPLPEDEDSPVTTAVSVEAEAFQAPTITDDMSHNAPDAGPSPGPIVAEEPTPPPDIPTAAPPFSPSAVSLPSTPWTSRATGDSSELAPSPRFAMLHALARRWQHPLPTRRFLLSVGSRSEARKLAPVIRSLRSRAAIEGRPEEVLVCATGENPASVRQVLESLRIAVDCDLDIISFGEEAAAASARMLSSFESLFAQVKPQWLIVEGATTASAMASVAAYYAGVRVARVEGGPTPFHAEDLYPAEIIRQVVGLFSSVHFAETDWSREHLVQEGVPDEEIFVIGNTGVDAVHEACAALGLQLGPSAVRSSGVVKVLIVVERRGLSEPEVIEICQVVRNLVGAVPGLYEFVWPLPASTTLTRTIRELLGRVHGVTLAPPADYADILRHIHACDIVLTDSPDLQEEAPSLGKPVLVMRASVDRPEAVRAGVAMLVGTERAGIQSAVRTLARKLSSRHGLITNPYGDGRASARIADFFEGRPVLEFGRTTQRRMLPPPSPPPAPLQLEASVDG